MQSNATSLCPGFKQVEQFGPDEEYEDEETFYVTLDLGNIEPTLVPTSTEYRLIGLDTPSPFLQLSGTIFKGQHESLLGTEILFTDAKDDQDPSKKYVTPLTTTERRIRFREVRVIPKNASAGSSAEGTGEGQEVQATETVPLTMSDAHGLERITGASAPTRRRPRSSKGQTRTPKTKTKKSKPLDSKDTTLAQELENEGTSMRPPEAMEVDG